jgi:predicted TIM-barrel enzyme
MKKKFKNFIKKVKKTIKAIDWKNIDTKTYAAYIMMVIAILNHVAVNFGFNPLVESETETYEYITDIMTAIIFIRNTWCNNSVTDQAIKADEYMDYIKERAAEEESESEG